MNSSLSYLPECRGQPGRVAPVNGRDETLRALLSGHSLLSRLPERDRVDLLQWSTVKTVREREYIFRSGDPGRSVLLVLKGYVKISVTTSTGREVVLEIVQPYGCFGELAVMNNCPRAADATAITQCRLLAIDGRRFARAVERSPEGLHAVMHLVSERLRHTTQQVLDSVALPASARLAKTLLHLARMREPALKEGERIDFRLSQSELGSMTGLTRESINKLLGAWREAGWIQLGSRSLELLDPDALERLVSEAETN